MTDVDRLLSEFIREYRAAGDADPLPFLRRASGADRAVLAALIDGFLATEPPPPFDPAAFAAFRTAPEHEQMVDRLLAGRETLTELRRGVGLNKADVGARLAERFGLAGRSASAKACYHEIETGQVAPTRVREDVWTALSDIFGRARDVVREAASAAFEGRAAETGAFARESGPHEAASPAPPSEADPVRRAFFHDLD
jgi:hypothetical protein